MILNIIYYLIPILMMIESGNDKNAIGDGGKAVGCLQIHKITVDDVNRICKLKKKKKEFKYTDRKSSMQSIEMCKIYLEYYGEKLKPEERTALNLGLLWNMGYKGFKDKPVNQSYARKLKKEMGL